jgi:MFS family permease
MFIFALANGILEAVANPLVATLYPKQRTHYLNMVHAAWPAGMILGVAAGWLLDDKMALNWKLQLSLYLIPTAIYGLMFLGQKYPKSEAAEKGASFVEMFKSVGILGSLVACYLLALFFGDIFKNISPEQSNLIGYGIGGLLLIVVAVMTKFSIGSFLLFALFITHALVGAVELGTDGWIQNITGNLFSSEQGKYLFLWTSAIMFGLRFCAHWIETKLKVSPIGLLFASSVIAFVGLTLASSMQTFTVAMVALGIYAVGKTFFWPTMLAVIGDRFPHTGAVAMSIMGGIGMLSAGLIGGPGLGYAKDRFAGEELKKSDAALYQEYKAEKPSTFLNIPATAAFGLDGKKLAEAKEAKEKTDSQKAVVLADQKGDRATLKADSFIPISMAVIYLLMFLYFKTIGGYKPLTVEEASGKA